MTHVRRFLPALAMLALAACQTGDEPSPTVSETLQMMAQHVGSDAVHRVVVADEQPDRAVRAAFRVEDQLVEVSRTNGGEIETLPEPSTNATAASFTVPVDDVDDALFSAAHSATTCDSPVTVLFVALPHHHAQVITRCGDEFVADYVDGEPIQPLAGTTPGELMRRASSLLRTLAPDDDVADVELESDGPRIRLALASASGTTFTGKPCYPTIILSHRAPALTTGCQDEEPSARQPQSALDPDIVDRIWETAGRPMPWHLVMPGEHWTLGTPGKPDVRFHLGGTPI